MKVEEIKLAFENNQKFEFSLIDDVKKENLRLIEWYDKVVNSYKDLASELERISALYQKNAKLAEDAMKKASDLGADDIYKTLLDNKNISDKYSKESSSKAKKIYSL